MIVGGIRRCYVVGLKGGRRVGLRVGSIICLKVFVRWVGIHIRQVRGRQNCVLKLEGLEIGRAGPGAGAGAVGAAGALTGIEERVLVEVVGVGQCVGGIQLDDRSRRPLLSGRRGRRQRSKVSPVATRGRTAERMAGK